MGFNHHFRQVNARLGGALSQNPDDPVPEPEPASPNTERLYQACVAHAQQLIMNERNNLALSAAPEGLAPSIEANNNEAATLLLKLKVPVEFLRELDQPASTFAAPRKVANNTMSQSSLSDFPGQRATSSLLSLRLS